MEGNGHDSKYYGRPRPDHASLCLLRRCSSADSLCPRTIDHGSDRHCARRQGRTCPASPKPTALRSTAGQETPRALTRCRPSVYEGVGLHTNDTRRCRLADTASVERSVIIDRPEAIHGSADTATSYLRLTVTSRYGRFLYRLVHSVNDIAYKASVSSFPSTVTIR